MRWVKCRWCKYNEGGDCRNPKSDNYKLDVRDVPHDGCEDGVEY